MAKDGNIIHIRVHIEKTDATKILRFGWEMSVSEVVKEIRTKHDDTGATAGGKDHSLYQAADKESKRPARWLEKNKTLRYYNLLQNVRS